MGGCHSLWASCLGTLMCSIWEWLLRVITIESVMLVELIKIFSVYFGFSHGDLILGAVLNIGQMLKKLNVGEGWKIYGMVVEN